MRQKRRMTGADFEAIRPFLKHISFERLEAARAALVDGTTYQTVGTSFGWSRQAVGDAVNAVWRAYESYQESRSAEARAGALVPPGWQRVTLVAPEHLVRKFKDEIAREPLPAMKKARQARATAKDPQ